MSDAGRKFSSFYASLFALFLYPAQVARATGFTDVGDDLVPRAQATLTLHGALRARGEALVNLDLDAGLTPSGAPLYPVPLGDPAGQVLTHADARLRTDLAAYAPGGGVAVKLRIDVLDHAALGSDAEGIPASSTTQASPAQAFHIERAYGEALTPVGLLAVGRMGSHFGLGLVANGGDCASCDHGDSADRIAFLSPLAGHIFAVAYDLSATGPQGRRPADARELDLDPGDDVRTVTVAALRWRSDWARERRRAAGKSTVDYGLAVAHRWQDDDVPSSYLPGAASPLSPAQVMSRDFRATTFDSWFRVTTRALVVEAEAALIVARAGQPSLIPGVELRDPVESLQVGFAVESTVSPPGAAWAFGLDAGLASGDPAPGFGAFPAPGQAPPPRPGDLDGAQASASDHRVDNFRFHPDYQIDRILFREIVGAVTDAVYARPHAAWHRALGPGTLSASLAAIASFAVEPNSTPSGKRGLGLELDPTLAWHSRDGFSLVAEYAVLFPLGGGLDAERTARAAQLFRLQAGFAW